MRRTLLILSSSLALSACNCGKSQGLLETSGILAVTPDALEFGAVTEFTSKTMSLSLENTGRGALTLSTVLEDGTSSEFTLGAAPVELAPGAKVDVQITFDARGPGEDVGAVVITSDEKDRAPVRVPLHAGAIWPTLVFVPDPLAFAPVSSTLDTRIATLKNVGGATLHMNSIGVNAGGNPGFSITPPVLPLTLAPDASVPVSVYYARSLSAAEGLLEAVSDDPSADGGVSGLRLLPDPSRVCGDGLDNDNDGLTDFPDDIGCTSPDDGDEYNPPECVTGGVQPCGNTMGTCRPGTRVCANSIWGGCDGGVRPQPEGCNGQDDDCNGMSDENISELCTINGCSGARICVANSGVDGGLYSNCIPISSMPEQCNGLDDNCNGQVDEGVVQTCTVFGCQGVKICVPGSDGGFTSCMPANPLPESCNSTDDDCNGQVDDLPDLVCGIGPCRRTAPACVSGNIGACLEGNPGTEACNGIDDDCNGFPDDNIAALSCGTGACVNTALACQADGGMNVCVPTLPTAETCNNSDDNCNGLTDELTDGGPIRQACYTGAPATRNVGRCRDGSAACASGVFGSCAGDVLPTSELCNNIDDNCNGPADDGIPNLTCGTGACFRSVAACVSGTTQTCSQGSATAETCNNIDDDCNGAIDNGVTQVCYSGPPATRNVGRCRDGTQTCAAGMFGACGGAQVLPNASEICGNSIDDNCVGGVDEGCSGCDPNGLWRVSGGNIAYSCTFGIVNINVGTFNMATNVPSAGTMTLIPQPTWTPGLSRPLRGPNATCPSGAMNVSVVYAGGCTETYRLQGSFTGANSWTGTFTATYTEVPLGSGGCFNCTDQSFPVTLVRP